MNNLMDEYVKERMQQGGWVGGGFFFLIYLFINFGFPFFYPKLFDTGNLGPGQKHPPAPFFGW
jgi:hypothetical protein